MRLALLALALVACAHVGRPAPKPWTVTGGTAAEQALALDLARAAGRLYPDGSVPNGGEIVLAPDVDACCGWRVPEPDGVWHYAGCLNGRVCVLWPHPKLPGADLTRSALPHELGHLALPLCTEAQADAAGLLIVQEYRRAGG